MTVSPKPDNVAQPQKFPQRDAAPFAGEAAEHGLGETGGSIGLDTPRKHRILLGSLDFSKV